MKKIPLDQLLKESGAEAYREQYRYVCGLIEKKRILPIKSSPLNGKKPALHQSYWLVEDVPDYEELVEELKFHILPVIQTDYYLKHPEVYQEERKWVRLLNEYFSQWSMGDVPAHMEHPETMELAEEARPVETMEFAEEAGPVEETGFMKATRSEETVDSVESGYVSLNERSFQIWGREKFLQREQGRKILAHCGVELKQLQVYDTTEPLACYSISKRVPQNVLILENKDTFYSMRRHLMKLYDQGTSPEGFDTGRNICDNRSSTHSGQIFGVEIGTLVYGAGKGILRSYEDFRFCVEPHINAPENQILYFGDLDYEGIGIYERLALLFENGYGRMGSWEDKKAEGGGRKAEGEDRKAGGEDRKAEGEDKEAEGHEDRGKGKCMAVYKVRPFVQAYEKMVWKAEICGMDFLPETSEKQNRNISGAFFSYFSRQMADKMRSILEAGKYIPQEIINIMDF